VRKVPAHIIKALGRRVIDAGMANLPTSVAPPLMINWEQRPVHPNNGPTYEPAVRISRGAWKVYRRRGGKWIAVKINAKYGSAKNLGSFDTLEGAQAACEQSIRAARTGWQ
jgi:hypothetical protein